MAFTIGDLRSKTDDDLIRLHDAKVEHVTIGIDYFLEELRRREQARALRASHRLAAASLVLAVVNAVVAVAAVWIALGA